VDITLRSLVAKPWFIEQGYADAQLPLIEKLMSGEAVSFTGMSSEEIAEKYAPMIAVNARGMFSMEPAADMSVNDAGVLVMSMEEPLMKKSFCGIPGSSEMVDMLKAADHEDRILAVVFKTDCPGGTVDGTQEFSNQVASMSKPVYFWVNGMNCSASAFVSAGATGVFASSNLCTFGSIGVMTTLRDTRKRMEAMGVTEIPIRATTSPDKNSTYYEALDGKPEGLQAELDVMDAEFMHTMRTHRNVKEEALTGHTYLTDKAVEMGLCDGVASLEEVINEAYAMGVQTRNSISINT
jgi:protease IV